ncbi:MAG: hypothetical protein KAJ91_02890 [Candidatus Aenigmarchaeota archaeon]|nr:hypothetical protein [Candidatus Aenigmarchaeota archaeon]MCK5333029.1 hypothetical protein [Candidatus Aenigmarchaeota archaeon]
MRENLYVLVCLLVVMSGCTQPGETKIQNSELLRLSDITVTPSSVVLPGEVITIRMKISNIGQEEAKFVRYDKTKGWLFVGNTENSLNNLLYDTCSIYTNQDVNIIADGFEKTGGQAILKPGRASILEWTITAPNEEVIAKMKHECDFKFRVSYEAQAETYTYIYFANPDEKNQRAYTNQDMNLRGENVANFGPVYINFDTAQTQPIKGSKSGKPINDWTIYVTLRNIGNGIGEIVSDSGLLVDLPSEITRSGTCTAFEVTDNDDLYIEKTEYDAVAETEDNLKLYSKQTSRFSCVLTAPKVSILEPYRFVSSANYTYTINEKVKIVTRPPM